MMRKFIDEFLHPFWTGIKFVIPVSAGGVIVVVGLSLAAERWPEALFIGLALICAIFIIWIVGLTLEI
jgi:O-antigen/teichoic acid export membrane protein